ncbi:hypothetical protein FRC19_007760 [Serendipita sp. 401]|nr:hypothetical protein FRC19_007760 [Serendipita sp. 401]KAG9057252.1 hypothetical protein FS842_008059 [Serendipita sp. 407]
MPKDTSAPPAQTIQLAADAFAPLDSSERVYKCTINGCKKNYGQSTDRNRHWWRHIPEELLPTCPFIGEFGYTCNYRYYGRSDLMRKHWAREHGKRAPYPDGYIFPTLKSICDLNNIVFQPSKYKGPKATPSATTAMDRNLIPDGMWENLHWSVEGHFFDVKPSMSLLPLTNSLLSSGASAAPADAMTTTFFPPIKEEEFWMDNSFFEQLALLGQPTQPMPTPMSVPANPQVDYLNIDFFRSNSGPNSDQESDFDSSFNSQVGTPWDVPSFDGFLSGFPAN